jgi:formylglycine-generating enzyme required for sulfatase activity
MELADGSLADRFKACRAAGLEGIPPEELLRYFAEAAEALDYLRQEKLAHRDIKPQNLLHVKGHAKVADFGIARAQANAIDRTIQPCGTPGYMPPEMWRGEISVHSDQYSFAITWYEMRTGRAIFPRKHLLPEVARQHEKDRPNVSAVPDPEQKVLLRALAKKPDRRFPSCQAFVNALRTALEPPPTPVPRPQGWGLKLMLAALTLSLIATLVALLWPRKEEVVSWQPRGWEPEDVKDLVEDRTGKRYYRRLVRQVGNEVVRVVVVPEDSSTDLPSFYVMENKVWNDLYAVFMADPESGRLLAKYSGRPGCTQLVKQADEWRKGGFAPNANPDPNRPPFLGVEGTDGRGFHRGRFPVFRVTVTESHCFAEWLEGRLPTQEQWRKAAGYEDSRTESYGGEPVEPGNGRAAIQRGDGPWPVDVGDLDVSIHGCRQRWSNGLEWTRDLLPRENEAAEIPLPKMLSTRMVYVQARSYRSREALTDAAMAVPNQRDCKKADPEVGFRIVLEQPGR